MPWILHSSDSEQNTLKEKEAGLQHFEESIWIEDEEEEKAGFFQTSARAFKGSSPLGVKCIFGEFNLQASNKHYSVCPSKHCLYSFQIGRGIPGQVKALLQCLSYSRVGGRLQCLWGLFLCQGSQWNTCRSFTLHRARALILK